MVKGVARRVIMISSPDPKLFEQALFLVRDEPEGSDSPEALLLEAERIAKRCLQAAPRGEGAGDLLPLFLSFLCGGGLASFIWLFVGMF